MPSLQLDNHRLWFNLNKKVKENSISSEVRFERPSDQGLEQFISLQSVWIPENKQQKEDM